ncbi:uncharacterized protein K452DRAFT_292983, partial [Aplosporella prunicola CBS 121167]
MHTQEPAHNRTLSPRAHTHPSPPARRPPPSAPPPAQHKAQRPAQTTKDLSRRVSKGKRGKLPTNPNPGQHSTYARNKSARSKQASKQASRTRLPNPTPALTHQAHTLTGPPNPSIPQSIIPSPYYSHQQPLGTSTLPKARPSIEHGTYRLISAGAATHTHARSTHAHPPSPRQAAPKPEQV